jgi:HlyD family secretion protein
MDASPAFSASRTPAATATRARRRLLMPIGLAAAVALGGLTWWRLSQPGPPSYTTAALDRGTVARSVTASGSVNPVLTIIVGSYVSGVIQSVSCDYNTRVTKGQVCAQIDPRPYQMTVAQEAAALATARAQVIKDQANLDYAEVNLKRGEDLLKLDSIARDTVDVARNARDQARAQLALDKAVVKQREATLNAAQINLGYTKIVSPVEGTVVSRNITQGQTVAASFQTPTLFLIATDLTKMQVDANVSESDIGGSGAAVKEGDAADFTVDAYPDKVFHARVAQVRQAPQTVQNVVTYDVVIAVGNPDLLLKPGMTANARIFTAAHKDVLRVPNAALRYSPGGAKGEASQQGQPAQGQAAQGQAAQGRAGQDQAANGQRAGQGRARQVWVLRDGRPQRVPVTTGLADDSYTEITGGGLKPGDRVVVSEQAGKGARKPAARPSLRL